jgi:hypothetical protein
MFRGIETLGLINDMSAGSGHLPGTIIDSLANIADGANKIQAGSRWKTFYRSASAFSCELFAVSCFEFEYPRTMFKLVMVVEHRIVGFSVHPHSIDDFEPTLS